jgi:hypothetical protein
MLCVGKFVEFYVSGNLKNVSCQGVCDILGIKDFMSVCQGIWDFRCQIHCGILDVSEFV